MTRALAIFLTLFATSVGAQDINYSDDQTATCLADAANPVAKHGCISASANHCMETTPGGFATVVVGACLDRERAFWDARLNDVYAQLLARQAEIDPLWNQSMRDMQRAWITYRDARCDYEFVQWGGGTGGTPGLIACLMHATAVQVFVLEQSL